MFKDFVSWWNDRSVGALRPQSAEVSSILRSHVGLGGARSPEGGSSRYGVRSLYPYKPDIDGVNHSALLL